MKKTVLTLAWACAASLALADVSFEVKNVEAHQRYPWNGKVDIDFNLTSSDANADFKVEVECTDHVGNTNIVLKTIKLNDAGSAATAFTLKAGQYRLTWNADADMPNRKLPNVSFAVFASLVGASESASYLVIDLSGGASAASYPVSYLSSVPSGGWTDTYKTTKLVMRKCPAGKDPLNRYTLTKDFYAGVFEVTQKQWYQVMGVYPSSSHGSGDAYPVYCVSYNMIRGTSSGSQWPTSAAVEADSFIGKIRQKTGLAELDLPTEAQWEYACRAGATTTYNLGNDEASLAAAGWYSGNAGGTTHPAGGKTANAWGLYDMHGNVWEWCLDWYGASLSGADPIGAASGSRRKNRGGSWYDFAGFCPSSYSDGYSPSYADCDLGFRLFRTMP